MCLLSKNAIKNPDTAEAQVEAWAWRQLDGLLHTGNYEGVATFEANGFTVVDPWVREDAQFAEAWPDHQGDYAVDDPWEHYGERVMTEYVRQLASLRGIDAPGRCRKLSDVRAGETIEYTGNSWSFGGSYDVVRESDTYADSARPAWAGDAPVIVEFMNDDTPVFFKIADLKESEWALADGPIAAEAAPEPALEEVECEQPIVSEHPFPACYHGPDGLTTDNVGYAQGILSDGVPFEAEEWLLDDEVWATVILPAGILPERCTSAGGPASQSREEVAYSRRGSNLTLGMAILGEVTDFDDIVWLVEYMERMGLVEFFGRERNASVRMLADVEGNVLLAADICFGTGYEEAELCVEMREFPCRKSSRVRVGCPVLQFADYANDKQKD